MECILGSNAQLAYTFYTADIDRYFYEKRLDCYITWRWATFDKNNLKRIQMDILYCQISICIRRLWVLSIFAICLVLLSTLSLFLHRCSWGFGFCVSQLIEVIVCGTTPIPSWSFNQTFLGQSHLRQPQWSFDACIVSSCCHFLRYIPRNSYNFQLW